MDKARGGRFARAYENAAERENAAWRADTPARHVPPSDEQFVAHHAAGRSATGWRLRFEHRCEAPALTLGH